MDKNYERIYGNVLLAMKWGYFPQYKDAKEVTDMVYNEKYGKRD